MINLTDGWNCFWAVVGIIFAPYLFIGIILLYAGYTKLAIMSFISFALTCMNWGTNLAKKD
jgi:hypothetical protein